MALHLIVDGYNLIGAGRGADRTDDGGLEMARDGLIEDLRQYKRSKGFRITVVFDGPGGRSGQELFPYKGIQVRFTHGGETADDAIIRLVRGAPAGTVVVTSDRPVAIACERLGATVVSSQRFRERLTASWLLEVKGESGDLGETANGHPPQRKKGASRKSPRRIRRNLDRLRRL